MRNKLWVGLAVAVLSVVFGIGVQAKAEPQPGTFVFAEFLGGELGAFVGGYFGFVLRLPIHIFGSNLCYGKGLLLNPTLRAISCEGIIKSHLGYLNYSTNEFFIKTAYTINPLRALGASTGVVLAGHRLGVSGNIFMAYLANGLWLTIQAAMIFFTKVSVYEKDMNDYEKFLLGVEEFLLDTPGIPAVLATIGYNIGAKMQSDQSKPAALSWQMPLVALKF